MSRDLSAILGSASNTDASSTATFGLPSGDEGAAINAIMACASEGGGAPSQTPDETGYAQTVSAPAIPLEDARSSVDTTNTSRPSTNTGARSSSQQPGSSSIVRSQRSTSRRRENTSNGANVTPMQGKPGKSRSPPDRSPGAHRRGASSSGSATAHTSGQPPEMTADEMLEELLAAHKRDSKELETSTHPNTGHEYDEVHDAANTADHATTFQPSKIQRVNMPVEDVDMGLISSPPEPVAPTLPTPASPEILSPWTLSPHPVAQTVPTPASPVISIPCSSCAKLRDQLAASQGKWETEKASLQQSAACATEAVLAEQRAVWEEEKSALDRRLNLAFEQAKHFNQMFLGLERRFDEREQEHQTQLRDVETRLVEQVQLGDQQGVELAKRAQALEELTRHLEDSRVEVRESTAERAALKNQVSAFENQAAQLDEALKNNVLKLQEAEVRLNILSEERGEDDIAKQLAESQVTLGNLQATITKLTNENEANTQKIRQLESRNVDEADRNQRAVSNKELELAIKANENVALKTEIERLINESRSDDGLERSQRSVAEKNLELEIKANEINALRQEIHRLKLDHKSKAEGVVNLVRTEQSKSTELNLDLKRLGERCQSLLERDKSQAELHRAEKAEWIETEESLRGEVTVLENQLIELQGAMNRTQARTMAESVNTKQPAHGSHDLADAARCSSPKDKTPASLNDLQAMIDKTVEKSMKKLSTSILNQLPRGSRDRAPQENGGGDGGNNDSHPNPPSPGDSDDSSSDDEDSHGGGGGFPDDGGGPPSEEPIPEPGNGEGDRGRRAGRGRSSSPNIRYRVKEADLLKIPSEFPTAASLSSWKVQVGKNLVAASGRWDEEEMGWFMETERAYSTFESLADSGEERFKSLDLKLAAALGPVVRKASNSFTLGIDLKEKIAAQKNRVLKGRQIVWLMYKHFQTNPNMGIVYSITDLSNLDWMGDPRMQSFLYVWYVMVNGMKEAISETTLRDLLLTKMEKSSELQHDLNFYYRMPDGDPEKSYQYLLDSMERYIQRASQRKNRKDFNGKHLEHILKCSHTALPGVGKEPKAKLSKAEKKARKLAQQKAQAESQGDRDASAAPAPKGGGKGGDKGPLSSQGTPYKEICYYFNHSTCQKGKQCTFKHVKLNDKEKGKLKKPNIKSRGNSQAAPKGGGPKGDGKGGGKASGWCHAHLRPGGCPHGKDCMFPHHDEAAVDEIKRAAAKKKAKRDPSKGKGQQK